MSNSLINKFSWFKDDIEVQEVERYPLSSKEKADLRLEEVKKRLESVDENDNDLQLKIQKLITSFELTKDVYVYKLLFIPELEDDDIFESQTIVSTTGNPKYLRKLIIQLEEEYKDMYPKCRIARIYLPKGISILHLPSVAGSPKDENEILLNNDLYYYVTDTGSVTSIRGIKYKVVDITASFAVEEETYQKYKNNPNPSLAALRKHDRKVKEKKLN